MVRNFIILFFFVFYLVGCASNGLPPTDGSKIEKGKEVYAPHGYYDLKKRERDQEEEE